MKNNKKLIISILSIIAIIALGTYAWITWNSPNNTTMTMTIGDLVDIKFTTGNDISTNSLIPVLDYNDGETTTFSVKNKADNDYIIDINIDITSIDNNLKVPSFKYKLLKSSTQNGTYTIFTEDNFENKAVGSNAIATIKIPANSTLYFKFILYIDSNMENNTNMMNKSLVATINATAHDNVPNSPDLVQGLIPVKYEGIKCSDISNPTYEQYPDCYDVSYDYSYTEEEFSDLVDYCVYAIGDRYDCTGFVTQIMNYGSYFWNSNGNVTQRDEFLENFVNDGGYSILDINRVYNGNNIIYNKLVKADSTNADNDWYDYDNKKWANAVLVSSTNRTTYMNANSGTEISEADILAYYVWIPRFKYKVWNINKTINVDSYNAQTTGIDIIFESEKQRSGNVSCNYNFAITNGGLSEICTGSNGDYYTHPAFTFGNDELRGIWVGKFELSSEDPSLTDGGGNSTTLTARIKPNVASWGYNTVDNFWKVIYDMQITNNIYGLNTSRSNTDSHMMKNMEWGAVAYLTNSKYGRCLNNECTEVTINNSIDHITGNAGNHLFDTEASGTTNAYNTTLGQLASTTGNIYGIYDMSGGESESVMGNMSTTSGSYTFYAYYSNGNYVYTGYEKYIDTYAYGTSYNNQTAYNRSRLGDATGETVSWYKEESGFLGDSSNSWLARGGGINLYSNPIYMYGLFCFYATYDNYLTTRNSLIFLSS